MIHYRIFSNFYEIAAQRMCKECRSFINKNSKILDLGCGSGIAGKNFNKYFQSEITGIDIIDQRIEKIPFMLYDGKNIPFPDNSFDVVMINFVLHHCESPIHILEEAKRVTKDKIIIYEDLPEGIISKIICKVHGLTFATFFQKNKEYGNFKKAEEWKKVFKKIGLELLFEKKIFSFLYQKLFVLKKGAYSSVG